MKVAANLLQSCTTAADASHWQGVFRACRTRNKTNKEK
jgi:hypothetical protein